MMRRAPSLTPIALVALAAFLGYVALSSTWPATFWSSDSALKMLQVDALAHGRVTIPYLGHAFDPTMRSAPLFGAFYEPSGDGLRLVWPLGFALLSLPLYELFGRWGLYVLPAACAAATVYASGRIAESLSLARPRASGLAAAVVVAVASPVLVYGVSFWEHAVAACLTTFAMLAVVRRRVVVGGALLAVAAAAFRAEVYTLVAAAGMAMLVVARSHVVRFAAGVAGGSIPLWLANVAMTGHALPLNAAKNFSQPTLTHLRESGWGSLVKYFLEPSPPWARPVAVAAAVAVVLVAAALRRPRDRAAPWVLLLLAIVVSVATLASWPRSIGDGHFDAPTCHGLLQASPIVLLAAAFRPSESNAPVEGRVLATTLVLYAPLYLAAICLTSSLGPAGGFTEWGPRFFLPFFPLAVPLAVVAVASARASESARPLLGAAAALALVGAWFQLAGVERLRAYALRKEAAGEMLARAPGPVVADVWFLPTLAPKTIIEKAAFSPPSYGDFADVLGALRRSGVRDVVYASFTSAAANEYLGMADAEGLGVVVTRDEPSDYSVHALGLELVPPRHTFADVTFGAGFYPEDSAGVRRWHWMPERGELSLAANGDAHALRFAASVLSEVVERHPTIVLRVDGADVDRFEPPHPHFVRRVPLPAREAANRQPLHVEFAISATQREAITGRILGLAISGIRTCD